MTDAYLLLTPILMFFVVALVGFVGCHLLFDLEEVPDVIPGPTGLEAIAGDGRVDLTWNLLANATEYYVERRDGMKPFAQISLTLDATTMSYPDTTVTNGVTYTYQVRARVNGRVTGESNRKTVTPGVDAVLKFIKQFTPGMLRSFAGWVGMGITVADRPVLVQKLARIYVPGNGTPNPSSHTVKLVHGFAPFADVPNGSVVVDFDGMGTGVDSDRFKYVQLTMPVTLQPMTEYFIISEEMSPGDEFHDSPGTRVTEREPANSLIVSRVYAVNGDGMGNYTTALPSMTFDLIYGPLNFQYSLPSP